MVGPARPLFVLFGSSIVQFSFSNDGWGSTLADIYARKVISDCSKEIFLLCVSWKVGNFFGLFVSIARNATFFGVFLNVGGHLGAGLRRVEL